MLYELALEDGDHFIVTELLLFALILVICGMEGVVILLVARDIVKLLVYPNET